MWRVKNRQAQKNFRQRKKVPVEAPLSLACQIDSREVLSCYHHPTSTIARGISVQQSLRHNEALLDQLA